MNPTELVRSLYGLCKFRSFQEQDETLNLLASSLRKHIYNISLDECSQVLSSLCRVGNRNPGLLERIRGRLSIEGVSSCSIHSLVNFMTCFARLGVKSPIKDQLWPTLASEVSNRVNPGMNRADLLSVLTSYSIAHVNRAHDRLFSVVSDQLSCVAIWSLEEVCKYVRACSRAQYRYIPALRICAKSIRYTGLERMERTDILSLSSGLEKLGVEIKEVDEEMNRRLIPISRKYKTWFRSS